MTARNRLRPGLTASLSFGLLVGLAGGGCSSDQQVTDPNASKALGARIKQLADGDDGPVTRKGRGKAARSPPGQAPGEAARRIQCTNNLKQLALACHNYVDSNLVFPPGAMYMGVVSFDGTPTPGSVSPPPALNRQRSYLLDLLQYLEQGNAY